MDEFSNDNNTPTNNEENNKPEVKVYKAEVLKENENVYRERTTTIKEKEIIGDSRPKSSLSQIILAFCAFITIIFAMYDKVLKPYLNENKAHPIVTSHTGKIDAQLINCKNNGKFVLLDCHVTNKDITQEVNFFNDGKIIDLSGMSTSKVYVQPDGTNSFNLSDKTEKSIELPQNVPVRIRLMYDFKTKDETITYASFNTSIGKIEFKDITVSNK